MLRLRPNRYRLIAGLLYVAIVLGVLGITRVGLPHWAWCMLGPNSQSCRATE